MNKMATSSRKVFTLNEYLYVKQLLIGRGYVAVPCATIKLNIYSDKMKVAPGVEVFVGGSFN